MQDHNPALQDVTVHCLGTSQRATLTHEARPVSAAVPAHASGVSATPLPTPSSISSLVLSIGVSCQSPRPWLCLHWAPSGHSAMAEISRHIWQEGLLRNTLCLPWRLPDRVPQALPTTPAPLASPLGLPASSHAGSQAALVSLSQVSPIFLPWPGDTRVIPLCSAPLRPHSGTTSHLESWRGGKSTKQRGSGDARRACRAGPPWNTVGLGAPKGTSWCPWERHQGDGNRLFPALPGGRVREGGISGNRTENQNQNPCEDDQVLERVVQRKAEILEAGSLWEWPESRAQCS